jgi:hypothetical protein
MSTIVDILGREIIDSRCASEDLGHIASYPGRGAF